MGNNDHPELAPKLNQSPTVTVIVSGPLKVSSNDPKVTIERK